MLTPRPLLQALPDDASGASDLPSASQSSAAAQQPQGSCSGWPLVDIIELKWLLAGEGIHIHVERLQTDPAYALRALNEAAGSASPTLRATALRLRNRLLPSA